MSLFTEQKKQAALGTLTHYFKSAYEAAGLLWGEDNEAEVQDALVELVKAVTEEEREQHRERW